MPTTRERTIARRQVEVRLDAEAAALMEDDLEFVGQRLGGQRRLADA